MNQFVIDELHPVLKVDATLASHPILKTIESPAEITEYFDTITYSKGGSLVRMLENLVTEEKLKNATTRYLNRHIYSTATTEDYLTAIEEEDGLDFDVKYVKQLLYCRTTIYLITFLLAGKSCKRGPNRWVCRWLKW